MDRTTAFFADLATSRPMIMGIVNVTPDSFSDGGQFNEAEAAIAHGKALLAEGAHILDIGGESTRPGAAPVTPSDEQARVLPVMAGLKDAVREAGAYLSIDTRHASTMAAALKAGADIINDVTALTGDAESLTVAAQHAVPVILMHMQGEPQKMQENPHYEDVLNDILAYLRERIAVCEAAGISASRLVVDPGIGFGKTLTHNLRLLRGLDRFDALDVPLLLGVSRKSFIAKLDDDAPADQRLGGSLAAALYGVSKGANILRVHDVAVTRQALSVWQAIEDAV